MKKKIKKQLAGIGADLFDRGWSIASSSNYSFRLDEEIMLITVSGRNKGDLGKDDFMEVRIHDLKAKQGTERPSAEAALHAMIYKNFKTANCVLHTHSVYCTLLTMTDKRDLSFSGYEMMKAIKGIKTHATEYILPVVENSQDMQEIEVAYKNKKTDPQLASAFAIAGHGLYVWRETSQLAKFQLEALEFLMECEYKKRLLRN